MRPGELPGGAVSGNDQRRSFVESGAASGAARAAGAARMCPIQQAIEIQIQGHIKSDGQQLGHSAQLPFIRMHCCWCRKASVEETMPAGKWLAARSATVASSAAVSTSAVPNPQHTHQASVCLCCEIRAAHCRLSSPWSQLGSCWRSRQWHQAQVEGSLGCPSSALVDASLPLHLHGATHQQCEKVIVVRRRRRGGAQHGRAGWAAMARWR